MDPWVGMISQRRELLPTPVFLPGEFHGQRSLAGYIPWGHKELDMTEQLSLSLQNIWLALCWSSPFPMNTEPLSEIMCNLKE